MLVIPFDRVDELTAGPRQLYERVVGACGQDVHDVTEVRVAETRVEIDVIDFDAPDWPRRTLSYGPA